MLLQALAAEAWGSTADYEPILAVLDRRASRVGITPAEMALRYVSALRTGRIQRRWVLALDTTCEQPAHWPARLSWAAHRPTCEAIVQTVQRFERGEMRATCKASHWGGMKLRSDAERAKSMPRVDCGKTSNTFFGEPSMLATEADGR